MRLAIALVLVVATSACRSEPFPVPEGELQGRDLIAGAVDAAVDAATPGGGVIVCGTTMCGVTTPCCSGDDGVTGTCLPPASCREVSRYACDDASDCGAGQLCCYTARTGAQCVPRGTCSSMGSRKLCKVAGDCEGMEQCCATSFGPGRPGYRICVAGPCPL